MGWDGRALGCCASASSVKGEVCICLPLLLAYCIALCVCVAHWQLHPRPVFSSLLLTPHSLPSPPPPLPASCPRQPSAPTSPTTAPTSATLTTPSRALPLAGHPWMPITRAAAARTLWTRLPSPTSRCRCAVSRGLRVFFCLLSLPATVVLAAAGAREGRLGERAVEIGVGGATGEAR